MELTERKLSSKRIYDGAVVRLRVDDVELPNGKTAKREIVEHNGAVCVLALFDDGRVPMVRQFRYAFEEAMLEIPAGKLDTPDENWEAAIRRELSEETGITANKVLYLGEFRPSVAIFTEAIHMYMATGLTQGETHPDDDEFLEVEYHSLENLVDMVMTGDIKDGKTIAAILKCHVLINCGYVPKSE